ncbi:7TM diverse intracellular signaling domain-containing protein [Rhodoflexus sp.]
MKTILPLVLLLYCGFLQAQAVLELQNPNRTYAVGLQSEFIEDSEKALTLADVRPGGKAADKFMPSGQLQPNFGFKNADYWLRFRVRAQAADGAWVLHFNKAQLWGIDVYQFDGDSLVQHYELGNRFPFTQRPVLYHNFVIPLGFPQGREQTFYVAFSGRHSHQYGMEISGQKWFFEQTQMADTILFLIVGALLSLGCYNAFLFVSTRNKAYLYYVAYIFSLTLAILAYNGIFYQYFIPNRPEETRLMFNLFVCFAEVSSIQFALRFLAIREYSPTVYRIALWLQAFVIGLTCFIIYANYGPSDSMYYWSLRMISWMIIFFACSMIALGIWRTLHRYRPAYFYLMAWTLFLLSTILISMRQAGLVQDSFLTTYAFQIAAVLEALTLSLGLADLINIQRRQINKAQTQTIALLQENEKIIQNQNTLLEQRVQERTEALNQVLDALNTQNANLDRINRNMQDSVRYASYIQNAILPQPQKISECLDDHFIYFAPRNVVSGDFYFVEKRNDMTIVAAVDCTGHGVPGAMVSMMGYDTLNEIVNKREITRPDLVLAEMHKGISQKLNQRETRNRDGMDMSVVAIDHAADVMYFAGAKNPIIYFQNGEKHIIKGDRYSIGGDLGGRSSTYGLHTIPLVGDTAFYLFSDGYQDQFGGAEQRKLGAARMQQMLADIHTLPMQEQFEHMKTGIEHWREAAQEEQTDDILLIGCRIFKK